MTNFPSELNIFFPLEATAGGLGLPLGFDFATGLGFSFNFGGLSDGSGFSIKLFIAV